MGRQRGILQTVEWSGQDRSIIVHKIDMGRQNIARGSVLTVREGQAAIFTHKGQMADVFLPGFYKLDTDSIPLLSRLMGWKFGFRDPFIAEIFFVNTTQFTNQKWGTSNPIILRDPEYGAIMIRGFGTYSFRVHDPFVFMKEISGTLHSFNTQDIVDYLRSKIITGLTGALGQSGLGILEMAQNTMELGRTVQTNLNDCFKDELGLELTRFNFENFSLPDELQAALKENTALNMRRGSMDVFMMKAQANAMQAAAANPGAGMAMGPMMGMGMGMGMGNMMGGMMANNMQQMHGMQQGGMGMPGPGMGPQGAMHPSQQQQQVAPPAAPAPAGGAAPAGARFCGECGTPATGGRFCGGCGTPLA